MDLFNDLEQQIKDIDKYITGLTSFHGLVSKNCFDNEDHEFVAVKIQQATQLREGLSDTLIRKREIYENQVMTMEQQLQSRQTNMEEFLELSGSGELFDAFPDVLEFFAKKQARLEESLGAIKRKLTSDLS